jgi:hypothetical protein
MRRDRANCPALSEDRAIANARAEVAWYELLLERLETVSGAWVDWCPELTGPSRRETGIDERADALRQAEGHLATALRRPVTGTMPGEPNDSSA